MTSSERLRGNPLALKELGWHMVLVVNIVFQSMMCNILLYLLSFLMNM